MIQEGQQGRGNAGLGGGQAQATPDDPDINAYVNTTDFFSVSVPCKFTSKDIVWDTEYDSKVPGRVYNCKDGDNEYEMSVINYTDILKIRAAQEHTAAAGGGGVDAYARIDLAASIDYACTKMRNEAAKVTYDAWHYINLIPGHELQYNLAERQARIRRRILAPVSPVHHEGHGACDGNSAATVHSVVRRGSAGRQRGSLPDDLPASLVDGIAQGSLRF